MKRFEQFSDQLSEMMKDYGMATVKESTRYPLLKKDLAYRLREKEGLKCNIFALRPSTNLMIFDVKKLLYAYRMANVISETFDEGKGIIDDDVKDLQSTMFGFAENA